MTHLNASAARKEFAEALNRVAYGHERIVLQRRGKKLAALVPLEDLLLLEEEDRLDLKSAKSRLREKGEVPYERLRGKLGL